MAIETPPTITPTPTPAPQRGDRPTFAGRVDLFITWLTVSVMQFAALAANVFNNATEAFNSAVAAANSALAALGSKNTAVDAAQDAIEAANSAALSAAMSASSAAGFVATSTTSNITGTGLMTFIVDPNKTFFRGMFVSAVSQSDINKYVTGQIDSFSGPNLIINAKAVGTPGQTVTDWIIGPSGAQGGPGPVGSLSGANLTGPLNMARAPDVVSASVMDIWSGAGNFMSITGNNLMTSFGVAPQAGASRELLIAENPSIQAGPFLRVRGLRAGRILKLGPGDELEVIAQATNILRVTITRVDGSSPSDRARTHSSILSFS